MSTTICAISTAMMPAAIGVLRISGAGARDILRRSCGPVPKARRVSVRRVRDPEGGTLVDQAMVLWMPGPGTYTGEDVAEIFAHGGVLNMQALLRLCLRLGARQAGRGEFTRRAFLNHKLDLVQAESVAQVIEARSTRGLQNAQALLAGDLGQRIRQLRRAALGLAADLEAAIDFADEEDTAQSVRTMTSGLSSLERALQQMVKSYAHRKALEGVAVALVGAVNVGKSSLLNALLGMERALVSTEEGTTRDYLEAQLSWDGLAVTLVDTAGRREVGAMSELEAAGHRLGERRVAVCDITAEVVDARRVGGLSELLAQPVEERRLLVVNKVDLLEPAGRRELMGWLDEWGRPAVMVSAKEADGLEDLRETVVEMAMPATELESFCITEKRHYEVLEHARQAAAEAYQAYAEGLPPELVVEHIREVLRGFGLLLGEQYSEEVLDMIFSRFCIGK